MATLSQTMAAEAPVLQQIGEARRLARWGVAVVLGGLLPVAAWMAFAPLSSAVVAQAYVKVDLNRRPVQHAEGGTVRQVLVRDGQHVKQGDALLVLGDVAVDAEKNRLDYRVLTERASMARLDAEQRMAQAVNFPPEVQTAAQDDPRLAGQIEKERSLFATRRDALLGQVRLLRAQRDKVAEEILALRAQIARASESMKFQKIDLDTNDKLRKEGFVSATRVAQIEGTVADYGVKIEERRSELARAEQRTVEIDLRMRALEGEYSQQASDQLKVATARLSEIEQDQRKSVDASARQVITAPASGEVIGLKYAAPGAVISPRETIADIVPDDMRLVTEARIRTEDISRIVRGQAADIRFTAFKYRTTQLVHGKVVYISADRLLDRPNEAPYYSVLVEAEPVSLAKAGDLKILAGMPAEIYIEGGQRTPLQYLLEPLTQMLRHAARER